MHAEERLHALDAVRAFALLSGIVLHATMSFMPALASIGYPADVLQSMTLQTTFYVIHVFRMTLFFMIAGFFARLMFHRKGMTSFVGDRVKRILVPLVVGWVVFGPLVMALIGIALRPDGIAARPAPAGPTPPSLFPLSHLWFLYYLLLFYVGALTVRWCVTKFVDPHGRVRTRIDSLLHSLVHGYTLPLMLATPIALCLYFTPNWIMWVGIASPDRGLTPQLPSVIGFGTAFAFGWLLQRQSDLIQVWKRRWAIHLVLAIVLTAVSLRVSELQADPHLPGLELITLGYAVCYTLAIWNWVFGIIGAGLRFFSKASAAGRYIADASYWMYLAHLPLVFALQMTVLRWPLHWSVKFPLLVGITVALLLLSYRYFVRYTYIGEVLNGRKYQRPILVPSSDASRVVPLAPRFTPSEARSVVAELAGVHKRYGGPAGTVALDGLDLHIQRGELLAILGPNGAGKTTAISLLLGLQEPDAGAVTLFGQPPHVMEARRQIGVMLQEVALPPEHRVRDLIDLSASYYPTPYAVDEVMALTRTTSLAKRPYGKLSGGQKRLVQFAIAVCGRPKLLFLDEPTTGLDVQAREAMWDTLRQLVRNGCSIVLTTHYLEEAEALADRVAVLARGHLVALGSVNEVRALVVRKRISCITTIGTEQIRHWPGVQSVSMDDQRVHITVSDAESVVRRLLIADPTLRELEVSRAGLAEAFNELTQEAA